MFRTPPLASRFIQRIRERAPQLKSATKKQIKSRLRNPNAVKPWLKPKRMVQGRLEIGLDSGSIDAETLSLHGARVLTPPSGSPLSDPGAAEAVRTPDTEPLLSQGIDSESGWAAPTDYQSGADASEGIAAGELEPNADAQWGRSDSVVRETGDSSASPTSLEAREEEGAGGSSMESTVAYMRAMAVASGQLEGEGGGLSGEVHHSDVRQSDITQAMTRFLQPSMSDPFPGQSVMSRRSVEQGISPQDTTNEQLEAAAGMQRVPLNAELSLGTQTNLQLEQSVKLRDGVSIPVNDERLLGSDHDRATTTPLPKRLNEGVNRLMRFSRYIALKEKDREEEFALEAQKSDDEGGEGAVKQSEGDRERFRKLKSKIGYGVLMRAQEDDLHALKNNLALAGSKLERELTNWEGVNLLDRNLGAAGEEMREKKTSMVLHNAEGFYIPRVGRDPCPGCGAVIQDSNHDDFGYVKPGAVEQWVAHYQRQTQLRAEYAERKYELEQYWAKYGKKVGDEWLDFMTQEEFTAIHKFTGRAFTCQRCAMLGQHRYSTASTVLSAADFSDEVRALRDERCVVVLVVDVTDLPGSMVVDLPGLISMNNPVIIAANKMDCVNERAFTYNGDNRTIHRCLVGEKYVEKWVIDQIRGFGLPKQQIRGIIPVSARRGWNVMKLVELIERETNITMARPGKPKPCYFVGVTNVGKSSLINTISTKLAPPTPPHPKARKVYFTEESRRFKGRTIVRSRWEVPKEELDGSEREAKEIYSAPHRHGNKRILTTSSLPGTTVKSVALKVGVKSAETFIYDTPGLHPNWSSYALKAHQITSPHSSDANVADTPLTLRDISRCSMRRRVRPVLSVLYEGETLHVGGCAAIDVVKAEHPLLFLRYTSIFVHSGTCPTEQSEVFWEDRVGTTLYPPAVVSPEPDTGRPKGLTNSKTYFFEMAPKNTIRPKADIFFCGVGWVSFCSSRPMDVLLRVRTLQGIVHGVRQPLRYRDLRPIGHWPVKRRRGGGSDVAMQKVVELYTDEMSRQSANDGGAVSLKEVRAYHNDLTDAEAANRRDEEEEATSVTADTDAVEPEDATYVDELPTSKEQVDDAGARGADSVKQRSTTIPFDDLMKELEQRGLVNK